MLPHTSPVSSRWALAGDGKMRSDGPDADPDSGAFEVAVVIYLHLKFSFRFGLVWMTITPYNNAATLVA